MKLKLLALACLATLAIAGCKPQAPAETAAPAATPRRPRCRRARGRRAPRCEFDQKAFAGTFSGADTKLVLAADGTYQLAETRAEKAGNRKRRRHLDRRGRTASASAWTRTARARKTACTRSSATTSSACSARTASRLQRLRLQPQARRRGEARADRLIALYPKSGP